MIYETQKKLSYRYLIHISILYTVICLAAVTVAYKFIQAGPSMQSGATFIFPLTYVLCDVVTEIYGYHIARKLVWLSLIAEVIFAIMITIIIQLPSPENWPHQASFDYVLGSSLRFVSAGVIGVISSSFINIYIISKFKIILRGRFFTLRSIFASALGTLILVLLTGTFAFYGKISNQALFTLLTSAYLLELIYTTIAAYPASLLVNFLKKRENSDVFDHDINYNPFMLKEYI